MSSMRKRRRRLQRWRRYEARTGYWLLPPGHERALCAVEREEDRRKVRTSTGRLPSRVTSGVRRDAVDLVAARHRPQRSSPHGHSHVAVQAVAAMTQPAQPARPPCPIGCPTDHLADVPPLTRSRRELMDAIGRGRVALGQGRRGVYWRRGTSGLASRVDGQVRKLEAAGWVRLGADGGTYELTEAGQAALAGGAR